MNNVSPSTASVSDRILLVLATLVALLPVLPHISDPVWQDEAYTLLRFCTRGWTYPFTDYHLPNNHVLLSSLLSVWWTPGDSPARIRALPMAAYFLTTVVLAVTVKRRFDATKAVAVLLVFASGAIVPNFSLQLRGYGVSWLFVVIMLAAYLDYVERGGKLSATIYSIAGAGLIACLPSNVLIVAVFSFAGILLLALGGERIGRGLTRILVISAGPMLGAFAYIGIWRYVLAATRHEFGSWGRSQLIGEFFGTLLADRLVYLPFAIIGSCICIRAARQGCNDARTLCAIAVSVVVVPMVFVLTTPASPFPRTLVPLLPIMAFVIGIVTVEGIQSFASIGTSKRSVQFFLLMLASGAVIQRQTENDCKRISALNRPDNLCKLYFHDGYRPEEVAAFISGHEELRGRPVLANVEAFYALLFLDISYRLDLDLRDIDDYVQSGVEGLPVLVTSGSENIDSLNRLEMPGETQYVNALDSGYFKVYAPKYATRGDGSAR